MTNRICRRCHRPLKEEEGRLCQRCRQERIERIKGYVRKVGTGAGAVAVGGALAKVVLAAGRAAAKGGIAAAKQVIGRYL